MTAPFTNSGGGVGRASSSEVASKRALKAARRSELLIGLALILGRRPAPAGRLAGTIGAAYSLLRFSLDFLRATDLPGADARWLGLTFAQWVCLPLFAGCTYLAVLPPTPRDITPRDHRCSS